MNFDRLKEAVAVMLGNGQRASMQDRRIDALCHITISKPAISVSQNDVWQI